jgi:hypothetical protein
METIKRIHKGCGGEVKNRRCSKCGKAWSRLTYSLAGDIGKKWVRFDPEEYRKRIREGRDLL